MIRLAIVEDNHIYLNALETYLSKAQDIEIVCVAIDLQSLPLLISAKPDVVIMDIDLGADSGITGIQLIKEVLPHTDIFMLTVFDDEEKIFKAIKAGAFGYLLKDENAENIAETLTQMHENGVGPISPGIAHKILQLVQNNEITLPQKNNGEKEKSHFNLTAREQEILKLLVQGLLYKEIGSKLDISPNTAKKHVLNIYSKLHVNSKAQALALAYEKGLI